MIFTSPKIDFLPPIFSIINFVCHFSSAYIWYFHWGRKFLFPSPQFDENEHSWCGNFHFTSSRFHENEFLEGGKFPFSSPKFHENEFPGGGKFQFSSSKFHHNDLPLGGKFFLSASKFLVSVSKLGCLSIKVGGPWRLFPGGTQHLRIVNSLSGLKKNITSKSELNSV